MAQCIGKKRFETEEDAARALDLIRNSPEAWTRAKVPVTYYECDVCRDWHLTAMKQKGVSRKRKGVVRG
jgi:hypothetical protein